MKGTLYGIGVGPGDPELLTLKALRLIKEADVIALPGEEPKETVAYKIVEGAYKEISEKVLLPVHMPMTKDPELLEKYHDEGAVLIKKELDKGKNVAFLTLGDPTVYSTYIYVHKRIKEMGYPTEIVSGITSFCAVSQAEYRSCRKGADASCDSGLLSGGGGVKVSGNKGVYEGRKENEESERSNFIFRCLWHDGRKLRDAGRKNI